jgi:Uri superfamily endonuclease
LIEILNSSHTLYAVHLNLIEDQKVVIGKLGGFSFQKGNYIYIGSAKRAIASRLARHKKIEKKKRWHLDYLRYHCEITRIITYEDSDGECALAENLRKETGGIYPIRGFGSSDCKCYSHLIWVPNKYKNWELV